MAKKVTLEQKIDALTSIVEKGFAAVAGDITDMKDDLTTIKLEMATKEQIVKLHMQVNGIETDIKTMKGYKLPSRVADLEEELFGKARG